MDPNRAFNKLNIDSFFMFESKLINLAHEISDLLVRIPDIKSSGNEIEIIVRNFFKKYLPIKYYISNGHIIDKHLSTSPQFDILIADNFFTPTLYKTMDETEFLTYESIYCVGEVKKSYSKDEYNTLENNISRIKNNLNREAVSSDYIEIEGKGYSIENHHNKFDIKNPLFFFYLSATSANIKSKDIKEMFASQKDWSSMPNVICLLDKGVFFNVNREQYAKGILDINLYPEFVNQPESKENSDWIFIQSDNHATNLGRLYFSILEHLNTTILKKPKMVDYMNNMFSIDKKSTIFTKDI